MNTDPVLGQARLTSSCEKERKMTDIDQLSKIDEIQSVKIISIYYIKLNKVKDRLQDGTYT